MKRDSVASVGGPALTLHISRIPDEFLAIISFKPPSHAIIQFSLGDNDHVILIWQVDYAASHTRLLMPSKRLQQL